MFSIDILRLYVLSTYTNNSMVYKHIKIKAMETLQSIDSTTLFIIITIKILGFYLHCIHCIHKYKAD